MAGGLDTLAAIRAYVRRVGVERREHLLCAVVHGALGLGERSNQGFERLLWRLAPFLGGFFEGVVVLVGQLDYLARVRPFASITLADKRSL